MGELIDFKSNGDEVRGYLAVPASGRAPGVMVMQEWWGLVPQIKRVCDRLADEGFVALAPDLYRGEIAEHTEMDKANELMTTLPPDRAARDMIGAIDYLLSRDEVSGNAVGVIGFCMGGMLTLRIAALAGDKVAAAAPFYGAPLGDDSLDWTKMSAQVRGHFAENDDFFGPGPVKDLEAKLQGMGKDVQFTVHADTGHAFCNEENPLGTHNAEKTDETWTATVAFLHDVLG